MPETMHLTPADVRDDPARLNARLETLYRVGRVLAHSLDFNETLRELLVVLSEGVQLDSGMVALFDPDTESLRVSSALGADAARAEAVIYRADEGIISAVRRENRAIVLARVRDDSRFLDRLGLYDQDRPFIGVPIRYGSTAIGVLAAQPPYSDVDVLAGHSHFMEMVASLVGQTVRLALGVEQERKRLTEERDQLRRTVRGQFGFSNIVGHTVEMKRVFEQVRQVAKWNTTVLLRGETGTGKELIASAIHFNSPRAQGTFVKLNCAALPENLLESELFGHEKGAFTGAMTLRKGRFELADGGSLFLDEIGEISPAFQAKLLRVLQEGEFERIGGTRTLRVDVRVIAATHRDLESLVAEGKFREDLYYRLAVMPIQLPALRERVEDIPEIARFLVERLSKAQGRPISLTDSGIRLLMHHDWPGNVRELENCLERAAVMSETGVIDREAVEQAGIVERVARPRPAQNVARADLDDPELDERERVIAALEQAGWVQAKAARLLGMTPRQIAYRIQTLDIKVRQI
ncbi:nif-specific transcriptional activator NifA [Plasticicumulans acidivorans]|uniref:Nif-specific regulatory protein n=1 Tax=Plasticicumulans acidivorans TaxID=886464 RepID=A0A317MQE0_9GAMM|nr:nif-specific transcriptional activator NifA [Plasticicumulans acidivorans]PWV58614.1 Nif-specific regulatory protein [Plasticicumulans acidivorans]